MMKVHVGADSQTGLVRSAVVVPANVHDKHALPALFRGREHQVHVDRGYQRWSEIIKAAAPEGRDSTNRRVRQPWGADERVRLRDPTRDARARG